MGLQLNRLQDCATAPIEGMLLDGPAPPAPDTRIDELAELIPKLRADLDSEVKRRLETALAKPVCNPLHKWGHDHSPAGAVQGVEIPCPPCGQGPPPPPFSTMARPAASSNDAVLTPVPETPPLQGPVVSSTVVDLTRD